MKEINKNGVYLFSVESGADVMTYFVQETLCCSLSPHGEAYDISAFFESGCPIRNMGYLDY